MKTIIAGTRTYTNYIQFKKYIDDMNMDITEVISGGARGVDSMAIDYAKEKKIKYTIYRADWDTHGKSAGYKRNVIMAENGERLIAFWDGESKGTKHMIDIANNKNLEVHVVNIKELETNENNN